VSVLGASRDVPGAPGEQSHSSANGKTNGAEAQVGYPVGTA
jgi:hypothetical protein